MNCSLNSVFITFCLIINIIYIKDSVKCEIIGPRNPFTCNFGQDAQLWWSTNDKGKIYSAMFGLKRSKNTEHDSQLVNINTYIQKVNYNSNMHPRYKNRVYFVGNLTMGHAWFTLRNVTLKDTREYFAVIRDGTGVGKYTVRLEVKTKSEVTKESDRIPITEKRQNVTQDLQPENKTINETGTPLILAGKTNSTQQLRGDYIIAFTIISYLILCVAHIDTYISVH